MPSRMQIGEVAALFDVTTKTLRHYEKLGLLKPERADNGYRLYSPEDVLRTQRIRQLQSLGLSLKEIARLLSREDEVLWEAVLRSLQDDVATEIALLREQLDQIERLLAQGLPPAEDSLPAPPDKVNDYLEQHLPQASLVAWRRDRQVYATLRAVTHTPSTGGEHGIFPSVRGNDTVWPSHPGQPLMVPSIMGGLAATGFDGRSIPEGWDGGYSQDAGERALLQALLALGRLQESDEERNQ